MQSTNKLSAGLLLFFLGIFHLGCGSPATSDESTTLDEAARQTYLEKGKAIAGATFTALSTKLQSALQEGGVAHAIEYCQLNAFPLVDSLSAVHGAEIRRTSLLVRNPKDAPTAVERAVLETYAAQNAAGEQLEPMVQALENQEVVFFAPIRTNAFCLQCHGVPGATLQLADYELIKEYYPNDEAIGYQDGDLRGMWSIRFRLE